MGRVTITFLSAPGVLFKRTDRLGPYLLIGDRGAMKPYLIFPYVLLLRADFDMP